LLFRRELAAADDAGARRKELIGEYQEKFASPYQAASRGYVDQIIEPAETRNQLIRALGLAQSKRVSVPRRKHGNIPL
jgi:acetyl-CoA carboxylase carboxyltransferase component